jgi:hypothetical protein
MMRATRPPEPLSRLLPEGRRWGFGAHSVMPYLTMNLQARPGGPDPADTIRNPVFSGMQGFLPTMPSGR